MNKCLSNFDSRADKQRFLEANHAAFMIPKKFDAAAYQNKIDEVRSPHVVVIIIFVCVCVVFVFFDGKKPRPLTLFSRTRKKLWKRRFSF